jgi:hypothetical protein
VQDRDAVANAITEAIFAPLLRESITDLAALVQTPAVAALQQPASPLQLQPAPQANRCVP